MEFVHSETELTTAATDLALGLVCAGFALQLLASAAHADFKRALWVGAFGLLAVGSLLGAVAHGLQIAETTRVWLWRPLYLSLGLAVALVGVAAARDWWGEPAARVALPWALGVGLFFFVLTQRLGGAFVLFIAYEAVAILFALVVYVALWARGALPGAGWMAAGVALSLAAAAVQVSSLSLRVGVRFDHNGLFHLIQIAGVALLAAGVRHSLRG
ncbi:MAG: hypothetical protein AB7I13_18820 [Vicinamibacterales bacterium]